MKTFVSTLAISAAFLATHASAASYDFSYSDLTDTFSGSLTTSSSGNPELITSLTGLFNGGAATLAPVGAVALSPTNNNLLYPAMTGTGYKSGTMGYLDASGIGFNVGGTLYNLYFDSPSNYDVQLGAGAFVGQGSFTITAVPEPASWALMILGVGGIGLRLRRERTNMGSESRDPFPA